MTHDPRLVAQCEQVVAHHNPTCRCDACRVVRGEETHWPRVYIEGVSLEGGGYCDPDAPWRRTLTGRVVRWAVARRWHPSVVERIGLGWDVNVHYRDGSTRMCDQSFAPTKRAAEHAALERAR